jgi:Na+/melibiose symporter-like transporter
MQKCRLQDTIIMFFKDFSIFLFIIPFFFIIIFFVFYLFLGYPEAINNLITIFVILISLTEIFVGVPIVKWIDDKLVNNRRIVIACVGYFLLMIISGFYLLTSFSILYMYDIFPITVISVISLIYAVKKFQRKT